MYGNIGSRIRLDFTVIDPAFNMASRLEALTKQLGKIVLLSRAFADLVGSDFELERVGNIRCAASATRSSCLPIMAEPEFLNAVLQELISEQRGPGGGFAKFVDLIA
jgi:hypothetical protein